jgi:hypothetical protein
VDLKELIPADVAARYDKAVQDEAFSRAVAFMELTEDLAGYPVVPMTLWHYLALRAINSPLLSGDLPTESELAAFLWLLNPAYRVEDPSAGRKRHLEACRRFCVPSKSLFRRRSWANRAAGALSVRREVIGRAREYVRATFADKDSRPGFGVSYYCDAGFVIGQFGREYGWSRLETLATPLAQIFQLQKEIREAKVPGAKFFNASDRILNEWIVSFNAKERQ